MNQVLALKLLRGAFMFVGAMVAFFAANSAFAVTLRPTHAPSKCLDISGVSSDEGANLIQWDCWGSANQDFNLVYRDQNQNGFVYSLVASHSGKCLAYRTGQNGDPIFQTDCNRPQGFFTFYYEVHQVENYVQLKTVTGKCVDISGVSAENGAQAVVWDCWDGPNQKFHTR